MKENLTILLFVLLAFSLGHTLGSRDVAGLKSANRQLVYEQKQNLRNDLRIAVYLSQTNSEAALQMLIPKIDSAFLAALEVSSSSYTTNDFVFFNDALNIRRSNSWMDSFSFTNWNSGRSNLFVVP